MVFYRQHCLLGKHHWDRPVASGDLFTHVSGSSSVTWPFEHSANPSPDRETGSSSLSGLPHIHDRTRKVKSPQAPITGHNTPSIEHMRNSAVHQVGPKEGFPSSAFSSSYASPYEPLMNPDSTVSTDKQTYAGHGKLPTYTR